MQAVDRDVRGGKPVGQLEGGHDLGEFALSVGARATVPVLDHEVVEVEGVLAEGGDVDDAGRGRSTQQGKQLEGQQESGQVVDGEA